MCEPAIHVLRSVFTRLDKMRLQVLPHWGLFVCFVLFFVFCIRQRLHFIAHFDFKQKIAHLFFHEIWKVWRMNALVHSVKVSNQGAVYFLNVLYQYHSALETKIKEVKLSSHPVLQMLAKGYYSTSCLSQIVK